MMKWLSDLIKKKSLIFVGAELTLFYFMIFGFICFHYVDYPKNLTLNELGDLLAGMFAPLAFLWMVITILMQGKELRLQREELCMQREELANSSAQLERQSNVMESQNLREEREAQNTEIEGKLKSFTEMLAGMELLAQDYRERIFSGRVTTPGFFEHRYFQYSLDALKQRVAITKVKINHNPNGRKNYDKLEKEIKGLVLCGDEIADLCDIYSMEDIISDTGFFKYIENLKSAIRMLDR